MLEAKSGTIIFTGVRTQYENVLHPEEIPDPPFPLPPQLVQATASLRGSAKFAGLAVGKFGLRALSQSLAREVGPQGVHISHVIIDGPVGMLLRLSRVLLLLLLAAALQAESDWLPFTDLPRTRSFMPDRTDEYFLNPAAIADTYFNLHQQHSSAWTYELELRPHVEKW